MDGLMDKIRAGNGSESVQKPSVQATLVLDHLCLKRYATIFPRLLLFYSERRRDLNAPLKIWPKNLSGLVMRQDFEEDISSIICVRVTICPSRSVMA